MDDFEKRVSTIAQGINDASASSDQFAVSQTPFHTHNGSDSQRIAFSGLSDTPNSYYKKAGKVATVNSTETGLTFSSASTVYAGLVNSDGSAGTPFPTGWSVAHTGTGIYTITHNLATTSYVPLLTSNASESFLLVGSGSITANDFIVRANNGSSSSADSAFYFAVVLT